MKRKQIQKQTIVFIAMLCCSCTVFAQQTISEVRHDFEKAATIRAKADACFNLSRKYADGLKIDSAQYFADRIKEFSQQDNYETGIGMHYLAAGGALRVRNRIKEAEENTSKAIEIFTRAKNFLLLGLAYQQLGAVYLLAESFDLSRRSYRIAIQYSTIAGDDNSLGRQLYEMGKSFHQTFDVDSAVFYLTRALKIAEKLKDKSRIFNSSGYLGSVFLSMNEPEKSSKYLYRAVNNQPPAASRVMVRIRLLDLAESLLMMNEFVKADSVLTAVDKMNETLDDAWGRIVLNKLRGIYALRKHNYSQALFHLRYAYQNSVELGNFNADIKNIEFHLAVAEYESGLYDSSIIHLREAARMARQLKFLKEEMNGYQFMSKAFEKKGMTDSALHYLLRYNSLKDSLLVHEKQKAVIEISAKYESEKKEQEIRMLQKESESNAVLVLLKNQEIEKQQLADEKKSQQLVLISKQNEINKLDASQKTLSLDNEKKENEKKQARLKLLEKEAAFQKLLAAKQNQQKNIAWASITVMLILGGTIIYRYIRRKRIQNQRQVLNERLRISRELHDEVGSTLTGIVMYSYLTKEQIKAAKTEEVEKSLSNIQQSAGEMVNKLNDIVWLVNPEKDSLQKLIERLEEYTDNVAMVKNIEVKIDVPDKLAAINLPVESRRDIYLFCKEAINNAVKYSNASLIELTMKELDNKKIEFLIHDNGKGFDAVIVKKGNGLMNMQQRAADINGVFSLQTAPGQGTIISLICKIT